MWAIIGFLNVSLDSRPAIRVFVPTYRRHLPLERALASLRAQTFTEWACEVHNDDPTDPFPTGLVRRLCDPRIELVNHERNLGPCATFNLFYRPTREPFYCLLEDDNWWESEFLETMFSAMQLHPNVTLAWCNQKIWEELPDGSWQDTGQLVNAEEDTEPRAVEFGDARQILGALHSNGAMLLRSRPNETYSTPSDFPFVAVEPLRERMISHPLLYLPQPLAIFAKTLQSARSESPGEAAIVQTVLAATFFRYAHYNDARLSELFADARGKQPPVTNAFLFAAFVEPTCRALLCHSRVGDWLLLLRGLVRRPNVLWEVLRSRRRHEGWWRLIDQHTAVRFSELRSQTRF